MYYLGHVIFAQSVEMDMTKVNAIMHWSSPTNLEEIQMFLGWASFYETFKWQYKKISIPMIDQLKSKGKPFTWKEEQQQSFYKIK